MAKILQKVKDLFSKPEATASEVIKARPKKKVKKKISAEKEVQTLEQLKQSIKSNGYYSIKKSSLFNLFNCHNTRATNVDKVINRLEAEGLFVSRLGMQELKWKDRVRIYKFPVDQLGHTFEDEEVFESAFADNEWYKLLDLQINCKPALPGQKSDRQFSPDGTKDRLDFRALDKDGNNVVVELKNKGGDKRIIEQVLRYRTDLMHHFNTRNVSCIIITGERCLHTAKAFRALPPNEQRVITWYLYKYDKDSPKQISFEEVTLEFINKHLALAELIRDEE